MFINRKETPMAIVRWSDPLRDFAQLQDRINRVFTDAHGRGADGLPTAGTWVPPVDIFQNDHALVLKVELPDIKREDIAVTVDHGTLTISGEKKLSGDVKNEQFHRIERRYGTFSRTFSLPPAIETSQVAADYRDGVLTVTLPMREEAKPRQITVEVAA